VTVAVRLGDHRRTGEIRGDPGRGSRRAAQPACGSLRPPSGRRRRDLGVADDEAVDTELLRGQTGGALQHLGAVVAGELDEQPGRAAGRSGTAPNPRRLSSTSTRRASSPSHAVGWWATTVGAASPAWSMLSKPIARTIRWAGSVTSRTIASVMTVRVPSEPTRGLGQVESFGQQVSRGVSGDLAD